MKLNDTFQIGVTHFESYGTIIVNGNSEQLCSHTLTYQLASFSPFHPEVERKVTIKEDGIDCP